MVQAKNWKVKMSCLVNCKVDLSYLTTSVAQGSRVLFQPTEEGREERTDMISRGVIYHRMHAPPGETEEGSRDIPVEMCDWCRRRGREIRADRVLCEDGRRYSKVKPHSHALAHSVMLLAACQWGTACVSWVVGPAWDGIESGMAVVSVD